MLSIGPKGKRVTFGVSGTGLSSSWALKERVSQSVPAPREKRQAIIQYPGAASVQPVPTRPSRFGRVVVLVLIFLAGFVVARISGA